MVDVVVIFLSCGFAGELPDRTSFCFTILRVSFRPLSFQVYSFETMDRASRNHLPVALQSNALVVPKGSFILEYTGSRLGRYEINIYVDLAPIGLTYPLSVLTVYSAPTDPERTTLSVMTAGDLTATINAGDTVYVYIHPHDKSGNPQVRR
jgi:hypothetical protein